ncbi:SEC-C metal-binding domain-containing protein [Kiritimatiellaeota bacterium B1221]|nr:SEC-C metal-binding domain-containing protein [Kiritimatiellaeota bacterium B1221]
MSEKIGVNAPCPCGSGKKYKKCCRDSPIPPTQSPDIFERVRKDAYRGRVGRERKRWCGKFLTWKTQRLKKLTEDQRKAQKELECKISCFKGCNHCCSQFVGATLQEAEGIVHWLYDNNEKRKKFIRQYPKWREKVRKHESIFQAVTEAGSRSFQNRGDKKLRDELLCKSQSYGMLDIKCPFLDDGACMIYPVRPFVCAAHSVTSPPEHCKATSNTPPLALNTEFNPGTPPAYFRGDEKLTIYAPVPQMVFEILHGGYLYLKHIPGLRGLEAEVLADPEYFKAMES